MSLFRSLVEGRAIRDNDLWGRWATGDDTGGNTFAGKIVDQTRALQNVAVHACVTLISDSVASMPLDAVKPDGNRRHPLDPQPGWISKPNPEDDRFSLVEAIVTSKLLDGNGYAEVIVDRVGRVAEVWPLNPLQVMAVRRTAAGEKVFDIQLSDGRIVYGAPQYRRGGPSGVLHVPAHRQAGSLKGSSPIMRAKQAIGLGLVTEEYGARFFGQGTHAGGIITIPGKASPDAVQALKDGWESAHSKPGKMHRPGVLSEGAKWEQLTVPPDAAQFLETRRFQVNEIARLYRVPPHLIADVDRSTSWGTGIEEQSIGFVVYTLRPWISRLESALSELIPGAGYARFNVEGLMRGNTKGRYDAYAIARQWGWMSANDIRALEDQDPITGGDTYVVPMNMGPLDRPPAPGGNQ